MSPVIPKERLAGYQRWQAGSFDKPAPAAEHPTTLLDDGHAAQPGAESVSTTVMDIPFPTADDLARINDEARAEGYRAGYEEGRAAGEAEFTTRTDEQVSQLSALVGNLHVSLAHLDQQIADQLLDLGLEVAAQVLRGSISVNRELLLPTIREAIAELPFHHGTISLHMNPVDAEMLQGIVKDQLAHTGAHIVADSSLSPGGCLIRAGNSEIDGSIEMRWRRVLEAIGAKANEWQTKP